jgi:hypothetical protein
MGPGVSSPTRPTSYPIVFNLVLALVAPLGFIAALLSLTIALPIGVLPFRVGAAALLALVPLVLALRASVHLYRRSVRGVFRAPVAIALILCGYAAIIGGLHQWRGLEPPHLITAADHLHRVYLLGESPPPLEVIEPKRPLREIYDRILPQPPRDEMPILSAPDGGPGMDAIEIWSSDGDFRARFIGVSARTDRLLFLDERRLLAIRPTGRALLIDAEKTEVIRPIDPPEILTEISVATSSNAAVIAGKTSAGETAIHYFDLASGTLRTSLRSKTYVTFGVTADLQRVFVVDRGRRGELLLLAYDLPSGEVEANIPKAVLNDPRRRKLKSLTSVVPIRGGEQVVLLDGTSAQLWNVTRKKAAPFPLPKAKIYPYGFAPGGHAYFHRRTDAGDPNPTGIYRLPEGGALVELETRGQPPRAFFANDGRSVAIGPVIFSTADGSAIGGGMPESFSLDRERWVVPARDGSAFVMPEAKDWVAVKSSRLAPIGVLPVRGERHGAVSPGGKLYAVRVRYPFDQWIAVLEELDRWQPPRG